MHTTLKRTGARVLTLLLLIGFCWIAPQIASAQDLPTAHPESSPNQAVRQYGAWTAAQIGSGGYGQNMLPTSNPDIWYTYMDVGGVWRSDDGGDSWRRITIDLGNSYPATRVRGLVVDPADPNHLVIATGTYFAGQRSGIYVTRDANAARPNWTNTQRLWWHEGATRYNGYVLVQAAPNSQTLYAASDGDGFYISDDFGDTWTAAGLANVYQASDITVDPADPARIWVSALDYTGFDFVAGSGETTVEGGLYFTTNRGGSWTKLHDYDESGATDAGIPLNGTPTEMVVLADGRLLGIFNNVVVKISSDNGQTWQLFATNIQLADNPIAEQFGQSGVTFASLTRGPNFTLVGAGDGRVYRLNDGATQWTEVNPAYRAEWRAENVTEGNWWGSQTNSPRFNTFGLGQSSLTVDPANPARWFATDRFSIWETTNAGATWSRSSNGIETTIVNHITRDADQPERVYASLSDLGLFISDDGGATFNLSPGDVRKVENGFGGAATFTVSSATSDNVLYAIGGGTIFNSSTQIYVSTNNGAGWASAAMNGIPAGRTVNALAVLGAGDSDELYATISGPVTGENGSGGVYRSTDRGQNWTLFGSGLDSNTPGDNFFAENHYGRPQELAVSSNGAMVAISIAQGELYYRDGGSWVFNDAAASFRGRLISVWSDPNQTGRFYAVVEGVGNANGGLWRSEDGGRSWVAEPLPGTIAPIGGWLAVDPANEGRLALATANGMVYRANANAGWSQVDRTLPVRFFNYATFSGNQLVVGTNGGGVFYTAVPGAVPAPDLGTIQGRIFIDENENGTFDEGEGSVSRARAALQSVNGEGQPAASLGTASSNGSGVYQFGNLPYGDYLLTISLPPGFALVGEAQARVTLDSASVQAPDFAALGSAGGNLYLPIVTK